MTRNQKIALGCGGGGCLGLILLAVAGVLIYYFAYQPSSRYTNINFNSNRSANVNRNSNDNGNSSSNSSSSTGSMSEDDKHKLYQAAAVTGDYELIRRVHVKIGIFNEDFTTGDKYQDFVAEHITWATQNYAFILSVNTPEKGRAYVNEHLD